MSIFLKAALVLFCILTWLVCYELGQLMGIARCIQVIHHV
jgi:hypothetical protein